MKGDLNNAAEYCEKNKATSLASLVPRQVPGNAVVENYKFKSLSRTKVPLLCIAIASHSLDCVKYLVKNGAEIEKPDGVPFIFFLFKINLSKISKKNYRFFLF